MSMNHDPYPRLYQFIGCCFHQDYDLEGETIEEIVHGYKEASSPTEIAHICSEMDQFLAEYGSAVESAFGQRWGWFSPMGLGYTVPAFFEELKRILNS
ncbi:contact-dependent growth inhibition system immunity protein [Achromobacter sp.]|uniref:contact-dependent growth inhibition system immunity protein n=1 Tax=Achromobacter sp. TaxID=134375 RepID=UPI003C73E729